MSGTAAKNEAGAGSDDAAAKGTAGNSGSKRKAAGRAGKCEKGAGTAESTERKTLRHGSGTGTDGAERNVCRRAGAAAERVL